MVEVAARGGRGPSLTGALPVPDHGGMSGDTSRRSFLGHGLAAFATAAGISGFVRPAFGSLHVADIGPLGAPDDLGFRLPHRFRARVVATAGQPVGKSGYVWPMFPDGGACFETDGGYIYVANAETSARAGGGASALRFDAEGKVVDAYRILANTNRNCAGGRTPEGTWLSCEEVSRGRVFECDPRGERVAKPRDELGWFQHEAAAVDPATGAIYLTEDERDGCLYRWRAARGLEVAVMERRGLVRWRRVPEPNPGDFGVSTRHQVKGACRFAGGEGIAYDNGRIVFATKYDSRVWQLALSRADDVPDRLRALHDPQRTPSVLAGADNVALRAGAVLVAEDGGNMELVVVDPDGRAAPLLQLTGQDASELTGPAFSPDGTVLHLSSQRAPTPDGLRGLTYAIEGPFAELLGPR